MEVSSEKLVIKLSNVYYSKSYIYEPENFYDEFGKQIFNTLYTRINDKYLDIYYHALKNKIKGIIDFNNYDKKTVLVLKKANYTIENLFKFDDFKNISSKGKNFFDSLMDVYDEKLIFNLYAKYFKTIGFNLGNFKRILKFMENNISDKQLHKSINLIFINLQEHKDSLKKNDIKFSMKLLMPFINKNYWIKDFVDWDIDIDEVIKNNLILVENFIENKTDDQIESFVNYLFVKGYSFNINLIKDIKNVVFWEKVFTIVPRERIIKSLNFEDNFSDVFNSLFQSLNKEEMKILFTMSKESASEPVIKQTFWQKVIELKNDYEITKYIFNGLGESVTDFGFILNNLIGEDIIDFCKKYNKFLENNYYVNIFLTKYLDKYGWNPKLENYILPTFYNPNLPAKYKMKYAIKNRNINIINECIDEKYYPKEKDVLININFLTHKNFRNLVKECIVEEEMSSNLKWIININENKMTYKGLNNLDLINVWCKYTVTGAYFISHFISRFIKLSEQENQIKEIIIGNRHDINPNKCLLELDFAKYRHIIIKSLMILSNKDFIINLHNKGFRFTLNDISIINRTNWYYVKHYYKLVSIA